jgi:SPP1 family holin
MNYPNSFDWAHVSKGSIVRGVLMVLVLINYILTALGKNPIPVDESFIANIITILITIGTFVSSYWKNNSFTKAAQEADKRLEELRNQ